MEVARKDHHNHDSQICNVTDDTKLNFNNMGSKKLKLTKYRFGTKLDKNHSRTSVRSHKNAERLLEQSKYITNLSSKKLSDTQIEVLSLGLKFIPSSNMYKTHISEAATNFSRSNRIKHFFRDHPPSKPHPFKPKSNWAPPQTWKITYIGSNNH